MSHPYWSCVARATLIGLVSADSLERCWGELQSRDVLRQFACAAVARKHRLDLQETVSFPKTTYKGVSIALVQGL